jgi:transcriptional regulator with XRE-family HTH domain
MIKRFPEKLRTLRQRRGMTQKQLAELLGFSTEVYISALENGRRKPGTELVLRLATIFGVTTDQLMRDELEVE